MKIEYDNGAIRKFIPFTIDGYSWFMLIGNDFPSILIDLNNGCRVNPEKSSWMGAMFLKNENFRYAKSMEIL